MKPKIECKHACRTNSKDYIRCGRDGSIRTIKKCGHECRRFELSKWHKFKQWLKDNW